MSGADQAVLPPIAAEFLREWGKSIAQVLEQTAGTKCTLAILTAEEIQAQRAAESDAFHLRFAAKGAVSGELAFSMPATAATRFGQTLLGETPSADPAAASATLTDDQRDACGELFRQFAGVASTSCRPLLLGEVEFAFGAAEKPAWTPETESGWKLTLEGREAVATRILLSAELSASLKQVESRAKEKAAASAAAASKAAEQAATAATAPATAPANADSAEHLVNEANLALILDVSLDASLRFGQKQMLFKEVLDLRPGSVIELDRRVQEPAELLVAGRVIAKGEVVVVDGNYGLRITEVAHPKDRLEWLNA